MDGITCDRCAKGLLIEEQVRYELTIIVKAAYDPMELTHVDLARSRKAEIKRLIAELEHISPEEAQDQVYRKLEFDLCPGCQRKYLDNPI